MNVNCSIILDKRSTKANGNHPLKLRIYSSTLVKTKMYSLNEDLNENDYNKIYFPEQNQRLTKELKDTKSDLDELIVRANEEIRKLDTFTFDNFERNFFRDKSSANSIHYYYTTKIIKLKQNDKIGTADSYQCSLNSLKSFIEHRNSKNKIENLKFTEIDKNWLEAYCQYMLSSGRSKTTIGIYLRPLSSIFNLAIQQKDLNRDHYPFGKNKFTIPKGGGVKKALSKEDLKTFFHSETLTEQQEKAKDFWFLSYAFNGINIQDIATLKYANLKNDKIEFIRKKTEDTNDKTIFITTFLNEYSSAILKKYGNSNKHKDSYIFPILEPNLTPEQQKGKVKRFTRFINQHIKIIAKNNNLPIDISTYWARHTFATNSVNNGASLEFMKEALGHSDTKTTQAYFAGFTDDKKKEFAQNLFSFEFS